jgi:tryptophan-rich sensory protein
MVGENEFFITFWVMAALLTATIAQVKGYSGLLLFPYALLLPPVALVHMLLKPWNNRYERTAGQRLAARAQQREMKLRG